MKVWGKLVAPDFLHGARKLTKVAAVYSAKKGPRVDSILLRLHCSVTIFILACGCGFLTLRDYFGSQIECMVYSPDPPPNFVNHYCWMDGAFSAYSQTKPPKEGYPGVKPLEVGDRVVYHKYYQWVYFVLIIQCAIFYIPKFLWRLAEGASGIRRVIDLVSNSDVSESMLASAPLIPGSDYSQASEHVSQTSCRETYGVCKQHVVRLPDDNGKEKHWFSSGPHRGDRENYFANGDVPYRLEYTDVSFQGTSLLRWFLLADACCLLNVCAQIWFTNVFLRGQFYTLGNRWYEHASDPGRRDPLAEIFPRMAKCSLHSFGPSGTGELRDVLCFLPLNVVNEKIYVTLWLWFAVLLCVCPAVFCWRLMYLIPAFRRALLREVAPSAGDSHIRLCSQHIGSWFVAYVVACNVRPSCSANLLLAFSRRKFWYAKKEPSRASHSVPNASADQEADDALSWSNGTIKV